MKNKSKIVNITKQFFKFGIVGTINTLNSWLVYYILIFFKINYLISNTIAYFASSLIGYFLNKIWVFKKKDQNTSKSLVKYYIVYITSYFLNMLCMYTIVDILNISEKLAPILVLFITVPFNFIFSKLWIFNQKPSLSKKELEKIAKEKHTFAICAYKESEFLEEAIKSVKENQTIKSNYLIVTSTPNDKISTLAKKYKIKYYIRNDKSDIQDDWNFACEKATTELVTIVHQDDIYIDTYLQNIIENYDPTATLYCTDYYPYKRGKQTIDINSKIRKRLKFFLKNKYLAKLKFFKVLSLSFGNSINCPSCTYNKKLIGGNIFTSDLKFALDWDTYLKLARRKGRFIYINKYLLNYRIHDEATTKQFIISNKRQIDDTIVFNKIWPKFMTKIIMKFYVKCYDTYSQGE